MLARQGSVVIAAKRSPTLDRRSSLPVMSLPQGLRPTLIQPQALATIPARSADTMSVHDVGLEEGPEIRRK